MFFRISMLLYILMGIDHEFFFAIVLSSTVHLVDHQRFHERLSRIVRAKEGYAVLVSFLPALLIKLHFDSAKW